MTHTSRWAAARGRLARWLWLAVFSTTFLVVPAAHAAPGDLDPSFGTAGVSRIAWPGEQVPQTRLTWTRQSDGKVVLLTHSERGDIIVKRFASDLSVDTSFGTGGTASLDLGHTDDHAAGIAVVAGGKIVIGGSTGGRFFAARLTSAGQLDPAYSGDGIVTLAAPLAPPRTGTGPAEASGFAVDNLDRVVVAGASDRTGGDDYSLAAARFTSAGTADVDFGDGGVAAGLGGAALTGPSVESLTTDASNRVLIAAVASGDTPLLLRLSSSGARDPSFGTGGFAPVTIGDAGSSGLGLPAVVALADSWVVLFGAEGKLARYTAGGAIDTSFGTDGIVSLPGPPAAIRGAIAVGDGLLIAHGTNLRMLTASGAAASSFGVAGVADLPVPYGGTTDSQPVDIASTSGGFVVTGTLALWYSVPGFPEPERGPRASVYAISGAGTVSGPTMSNPIKVSGLRVQGIEVARQTTGKLVVLAQRGAPNEFPRAGALTRLNAGGSIDPSFGTAGFVEALDEPSYAAADLLVQPDDKIVLGASGHVWRRTPSGQPDPAFGTGGDVALGGLRVGALARAADGSIVVAANQASSPYAAIIKRLTPAGVSDPGFGTGGQTVLGELGTVSDLQIGPAGDLFIGGDDGRVARLGATGNRVSGFGTEGITQIRPDGFIPAVKLAPTPSGVLVAYPTSTEGGVIQLRGDGTEDPAFFADRPHYDGESAPRRWPTGIVRQGDGRILLAVQVGDRSGVIRLNPDGTLDESFGVAGQVVTALGQGTSGVGGLALIPDGKAVVVGSSNGDITALRYLGGGAAVPPARPIVTPSVQDGVPGGYIRVTLHLGAPASSPVTVHVTTQADTAVPGVDFTPLDRDVTIPAGATAATVDVPLLVNPAAREDRYLTVHVASTQARLRSTEMQALIDVPEPPDDPGTGPPAPPESSDHSGVAGSSNGVGTVVAPLAPTGPSLPPSSPTATADSALRQALSAVRTKPPTLRALAKAKALPLRFTAPAAGTVAARLYSGKRQTASKVIAAIRRKLSGPGAIALRAPLTARGKQWVRGRRAQTTLLVITFTSATGSITTASTALQVRP